MNEHSFAKKIVSKCRPRVGISWKINDNYAGGIPDSLFIGPENALWIEFKWLGKLPKRESTIVKPQLSKLQLSWMRRLQENNQLSLAVIGMPKVCIVFTSIETMENGILNKDIQTMTHNELVELIVSTTQGR